MVIVNSKGIRIVSKAKSKEQMLNKQIKSRINVVLGSKVEWEHPSIQTPIYLIMYIMMKIKSYLCFDILLG